MVSSVQGQHTDSAGIVAKNPEGSMAKLKVVENDMGFSAHQRVNSFS